MKKDVIIIGGGAAGLMCALTAGQRGRRVMVLEHTAKIAEKIRISGGGRCNFTNIHCSPSRFLSKNPHFCVSALQRYTQHDFIRMVEDHGIAYHEKTLGQLFCDNSSGDIIRMLLDECKKHNVEISTDISIRQVSKSENGDFTVETAKGGLLASSVVMACGGLSIPKIGASSFGYDVARKFGLNIVPTRAGLVPLTFDPALLAHTKELSGVSVDPVTVKSESGDSFKEAMLFTHRGLSGPAVLQISSYWREGENIIINLSPDQEALPWLKERRQAQPKAMAHTILSEILSRRLAQAIVDDLSVTGRIADMSDKILQQVAVRIESWSVKPSGSEGYRTAEVTLGGVDTNELSSKTFESKKVPGLYFIGEVVDVTGHLGGFNFQWAWSSGWCAGQYV